MLVAKAASPYSGKHCIYKGHEYVIDYAGKTKFGLRAKLHFLTDPDKFFWVDLDKISVIGQPEDYTQSSSTSLFVTPGKPKKVDASDFIAPFPVDPNDFFGKFYGDSSDVNGEKKPKEKVAPTPNEEKFAVHQTLETITAEQREALARVRGMLPAGGTDFIDCLDISSLTKHEADSLLVEALSKL
jgi:hypothetical protein